MEEFMEVFLIKFLVEIRESLFSGLYITPSTPLTLPISYECYITKVSKLTPFSEVALLDERMLRAFRVHIQ